MNRAEVKAKGQAISAKLAADEAANALAIQQKLEAEAANIEAEKAAIDSKMATLESENQQLKAKLSKLETKVDTFIKVDDHEKKELANAISELSEQISTAGECHDLPND